MDDLVKAMGVLVRAFGRIAVGLWIWGPHPDSAYERGGYGGRSRTGRTYRRTWRAGQVIGWSLIAGLVVFGLTLVLEL